MTNNTCAIKCNKRVVLELREEELPRQGDFPEVERSKSNWKGE